MSRRRPTPPADPLAAASPRLQRWLEKLARGDRADTPSGRLPEHAKPAARPARKGVVR